MKDYNAIIDIGSSKVLCLICSAGQGDAMIVHGAGIREYEGYRHGVLQSEKGLHDAVVDALQAAETEARHPVRDISVGVPAPFMRLMMQDGATQVRTGHVTANDVEALVNASLAFEMPEGLTLMHSTPTGFFTDETFRLDVPLGAPAKNLSATVSHALLDTHFKEIVSAALGSIGLDADMYIGVPLSESIFVIPEEDRLRGAVLLDVGATHTDVCFVRGGALLCMRTIDVGGAHFTNDLAYGLHVQNAVAEGVKRRYVYALDYQDSIDLIRVPGGGTMKVEHAAIQFIIEARTRELAELIVRAMLDMGVELTTDLPVYLTGGGISLMRGSCEFLEHCIGIPIQVRMPWMPRLSSPNYASAYSVMAFVTRAQGGGDAGRVQGMSNKGKFMRKLKELFIK